SSATSCVSVWPPRRSSASSTTTSCSRASRYALASPAMPEPTTAIRIVSALQLLRRHRLEIPDDAERGEQAQRVVGDVDFPPVEALARRAREVVVVVVPALAECDQREPEVVAAGVARRVP